MESESSAPSLEKQLAAPEEEEALPPKHTNQPIPLPASFVPVPTGAFRAHRKALQVIAQPGTPRAARTAAAVFPAPIPGPAPFPLPQLQGSRVLQWKQDPTVGEIGVRKAYLPGHVQTGPKDARIEVKGLPLVSPNAFGDYIAVPGTDAFDSIHTFAVVRQVLTMYQRARGGAVLPWQWNTGGNTEKLDVHPHAGETQNAFYSRDEQALKFFFFNTSAPPPLHRVYTCRSLDIVAHETGHAILDALKPNWLLNNQPPQTGGLHEAFGDITAIFLALSQLDQVEAIIAQTKANLHNKTFLADLAEEFGLALGRPNGLRNADNDLTLSQVGTEVHAISQVFTGAIYDILADIFAFRRNSALHDDAVTLQDTGQYMLGLVLQAIINAPASGATFAHIANQMLIIAAGDGSPVQYRNFIRNRFTLRQVVVSPVPLSEDHEMTEQLEAGVTDDPNAQQDRQGCCGTMNHYEYLGKPEELDSEYKQIKKAAGGKTKHAAE